MDAVLTGHCGPNALQTLAAAEIGLFADQAGCVKEVVERFRQGNLRLTHETTVDNHFGMGAGAGQGGGGIGGRGIKGDRDQVRGPAVPGLKAPNSPGSSIQSKVRELEDLKLQAGRLNEKMKNVVSRINNFEKH